MVNLRKILAALLLLTFAAGVFSGCNTKESKSFQTMEDFSQAQIGVLTGSSHDNTVKKHFPNAERVYFNNMADMILAVEQEKIDCYIEDEPFVAPLRWQGLSLECFDETLGQMNNGFVFPQGEDSRALREQINSFLAEAKADGTIDRLHQKWMGATEPTEIPDYASLTGENGTIRLAISVDNKPILYQQGAGFTGFEMELLTLFGKQAGYKFDIEVIPFESIIAGISSGKYDMGASSLNITAEREESVDFSEPYSSFDVVLVIKDDGINENKTTQYDFENATLGILSGSSFDSLARERFPNAQRQYYTMVTDMLLAVEQGKVDAYIEEETSVTAAIWEGAKIKIVEVIEQTDAAYIFQKNGANAAVREQLNEFIRKSKENGLLKELEIKWLCGAEPGEMLDANSLTGENGTLRVAVTPDLKPLSYIKDGTIVGYDVELLLHFAKEYGYQLEFTPMTFDAILPGVVAAKYDIGAGGISITEERAQSIDFSESYSTTDVVMVVKAEEAVAVQPGFWDEVKEDFQKTFLREARWKMIVKGIGITMFISIGSAVAGTLLGFGLYMLSCSDVTLTQALAKGFAKVYSRIIAGTPVIVVLMILFYVIFGKMRDISGILVAIIGFTLTFGAFVYDHMTVSVSSVDRGQTDAAYALGYTKNKTFFRIIFPQAMSVFMPSYCGQAVELIKATAVVGYIAVNDLTKVGDIIRSNTYEAFFPPSFAAVRLLQK